MGYSQASIYGIVFQELLGYMKKSNSDGNEKCSTKFYKIGGARKSSAIISVDCTLKQLKIQRNKEFGLPNNIFFEQETNCRPGFHSR